MLVAFWAGALVIMWALIGEDGLPLAKKFWAGRAGTLRYVIMAMQCSACNGGLLLIRGILIVMWRHPDECSARVKAT
jgi:hypothetical protein